MNNNSTFSSSWQGKIPLGGRFAPRGGCFVHIWGQRLIFWPKMIMSFYFYNMIHFTKKILPRIWQALGYRSISKSSIHWFLRYEPRFLGWASCHVLPYLASHFIVEASNLRVILPNILWRSRDTSYARGSRLCTVPDSVLQEHAGHRSLVLQDRTSGCYSTRFKFPRLFYLITKP